MDRFDQTIQKRLAVLVASALVLGIFAPKEVKAQQASASSTQQDRAASGEAKAVDKTAAKTLAKTTPAKTLPAHRTFSSCVISIRLRRERVA
jgi:long-subunit fatty acid transport protein